MAEIKVDPKAADAAKSAEQRHQADVIRQNEEKAGVNQSNIEGKVDSTKPPGQQDLTGKTAAPPATPKEAGKNPSGPATPTVPAPASSKPSESKVTTANAPSPLKVAAEDATHKENAVKAESKPKNEAADGPDSQSKRAAADRAEHAGEDEDDEDEDGPLDEQPEHLVPEGQETILVRIIKPIASMNFAGVDVLEALKRTQLRVGDEVSIAEGVAEHLVDVGRAVYIHGSGANAEVATREEVRQHNARR